MTIKSYRELEVWQIGIEVATEIYQLTNLPTFKHDYSLKDQMRSSAVSISSNIAEGYERDSRKEFVRYLRIAKGSLSEVQTQLLISTNVGYLSNIDRNKIEEDLEVLGKRIGALIKYLQTSNQQLAN